MKARQNTSGDLSFPDHDTESANTYSLPIHILDTDIPHVQGSSEVERAACAGDETGAHAADMAGIELYAERHKCIVIDHQCGCNTSQSFGKHGGGTSVE